MKEKLKTYIQTSKNYILTHKKVLSIAGPIGATVIVLVVLGALLFNADHSGVPKIVYQPAKACDLLSPAKAQDLLGDKVRGTDANTPVVLGNTATSKCSYTDENPDPTKMMIAAVAIRSGINDEGVEQNKMNFASSKLDASVEAVTSLGDDAFYNQTSGQLNVLSGKNWLILNYGVGNSPEANTIDQEVKFARKILNS